MVILVGIIVSAFAGNGYAQTTNQIQNVEDAIEIAIQNNGNMQMARYKVDIAGLGKKSAINIEQTNFEIQYGQYNSFENDFAFNIQQNIAFPTVYSAQRKLANIELKGSELDFEIEKNELRRNVRKAWYELAYLLEKDKLLNYQSELFTEFLRASQIRYETQATSLLEKAGAEMRVQEVLNNLDILASDIEIANHNLRVLLNDTTNLSFRHDTLPEYTGSGMSVESHPLLARIALEKSISEAEKSVESSKILPNLSVGYFNQSLIGIPTESGDIATSSDRYSGINAGIGIPLFFGSQKAEIKKATLRGKIAESNAFYTRQVLEGAYKSQILEVEKLRRSLNYYENSAIPQADLIIDNAGKSFMGGAIDYVEYFQNLNVALEIKQKYLETLNAYNQSLIDLDYLMGQ